MAMAAERHSCLMHLRINRKNESNGRLPWR
jgi:hypothetical protein